MKHDRGFGSSGFYLAALTTFLAIAAGVGCGKKENAQRKTGGSAAEAKAVFMEMLEPDANFAAILVKYKPTHEDYLAVFEPDHAEKLEKHVSPAWEMMEEEAKKPSEDRPAREGFVDVVIYSASPDDFKNGAKAAEEFPDSYKEIASKFKDGITVHGARFAKEDGKEGGDFMQALIFVNGRWCIFPDPFRVGEPPKKETLSDIDPARPSDAIKTDIDQSHLHPVDEPETAPEGSAKALLDPFVQPNADHAALTKALQPTHDDYLAVFEPDFAAVIEESHRPLWESPDMVVMPNEGQTEVLLFETTTDDIRAWTPEVKDHFPGGYESIHEKFQPGLTICRFKFVKPGETIGMAFDGLIYVNGRWVLIPKPWRVQRP